VEYRTFGGTGIQVSRQCLGAMMFGRMGNPDHAECVRMTHAALDAGINFIDTADGYSQGESEQILAKALQGRRAQVVLATKCHFPMGRDPNERGGSRRWILRAVEASLGRLETDWIDLLQLHRRDPHTELEESLSALTDLVRQGKIRAFGMSATPAETIVEAQWVAERRALYRVRGEQCLYSIFNRAAERAVFGTARRYGLGVLTYGPLCGGWLSGKYRRDAEVPPGSRALGPLGRNARWDAAREEVQHKYDLLDALDALALEAGLPLTHLALGFAAEHPAVSSVIIGPRTPEQLADNLAAADVRLAPEVLDRIDALVPPGSDVDARDTIAQNPALDDPHERRRRR
jgi:aryl-alcohol dehydrogenase-like predicted oxidoreductase